MCCWGEIKFSNSGQKYTNPGFILSLLLVSKSCVVLVAFLSVAGLVVTRQVLRLLTIFGLFVQAENKLYFVNSFVRYDDITFYYVLKEDEGLYEIS